jgi:hypothetical protein
LKIAELKFDAMRNTLMHAKMISDYRGVFVIFGALKEFEILSST